MRADRPSRTAQQNALFRALEARRPVAERIADDGLAVRFLPPGFRVLAELARLPAIRRAIETVIDRRWPGPRAGQVVRTAFIDQRIQDHLGGVEQVLVLGAGFDSRPYRLPGIDAVRVFEVDHPATQSTKRRSVARTIGDDSSHVTYVAVDFKSDDLRDELSRAGFSFGVQTLVLWEGVTNYLTADAVDGTFRCIAGIIRAQSPVLFTYVDRGILDGSEAFEGASESSDAVRKVGEPYTFGFDPQEVGAYLADRGLALVCDLPVSEIAPRYYTGSHRPSVYAYYHVVEARKS